AIDRELRAAPYRLRGRQYLEQWVSGRVDNGVAAWASSAFGPVTPHPDASVLPPAADVSAERLRADPALLARLRAAVAPLTEPQLRAGPGRRGPRAPAPDDDLSTVLDWLKARRTLAGVPFCHLVPDARMLPAESLRVFYLDPVWIRALTEGALSVGLAHRFDHAANEVVFGGGSVVLPEPGTHRTGVLIRSRLVAGWPSLEVRPYTAREQTPGEDPLPVVRREHLAADVLFVLIEGVPGRLELAEPQQGLHFGIDEWVPPGLYEPVDNGIIRLRALEESSEHRLGQETGEQFPDTPGLDAYRRTPGDKTVNVMNIGKLADALREAVGFPEDRKLTPSEFAIQMINAAQRRTFRAAHQNLPPAQKEHHDV
ncbi:hypothetical protein ACSNOC_25530, partial [Streptomyces sp. URMC 129]